jgi:hypothetical protein
MLFYNYKLERNITNLHSQTLRILDKEFVNSSKTKTHIYITYDNVLSDESIEALKYIGFDCVFDMEMEYWMLKIERYRICVSIMVLDFLIFIICLSLILKFFKYT